MGNDSGSFPESVPRAPICDLYTLCVLQRAPGLIGHLCSDGGPQLAAVLG